MEITKILCALDASPLTEEVFDLGFSLSQKLGAELALVTILEPVVPGDSTSIDTLSTILEDDILTLYAQLLQKKQNPFVFKFIEGGNPKSKINQIATQWEANLIILGSHGRTGLARVLMGSVAESVLRQSKCPVLIVPIHK